MGKRFFGVRAPLQHALGFDQYVVSGLLGRGGFGITYLVHDEALQKDFALSLLAGLKWRSIVNRQSIIQNHQVPKICVSTVLAAPPTDCNIAISGPSS